MSNIIIDRRREWRVRIVNHVSDLTGITLGYEYDNKIYVSADGWGSGYVERGTLIKVFYTWSRTRESLTSLRLAIFSVVDAGEDDDVKSRRRLYEMFVAPVVVNV